LFYKKKEMQPKTVVLAVCMAISIFYTFFPHSAHIWVARKLTGKYYYDLPHQVHVAFGVSLGLITLWQIRKTQSLSF
jgi:hypothetical protein